MIFKFDGFKINTDQVVVTRDIYNGTGNARSKVAVDYHMSDGTVSRLTVEESDHIDTTLGSEINDTFGG